MREQTRKIMILVAAYFAFVVVMLIAAFAPLSAQQAQHVRLSHCVTPQQAIDSDRAEAGADFRGSHIFTQKEVVKLVAAAAQDGAEAPDINTVAVVYAVVDGIEMAGVYVGKDGTVCEAFILPAATARKYFNEVLGRRA